MSCSAEGSHSGKIKYSWRVAEPITRRGRTWPRIFGCRILRAFSEGWDGFSRFRCCTWPACRSIHTANGITFDFYPFVRISLNVTINSNNQISETGFSYDASGNTLGDGVNSYAWNGAGQMKSASGINYNVRW
jgi:hypothetical protein